VIKIVEFSLIKIRRQNIKIVNIHLYRFFLDVYIFTQIKNILLDVLNKHYLIYFFKKIFFRCPYLIVGHGLSAVKISHYFASQLSDTSKFKLITYLKNQLKIVLAVNHKSDS
jgi:hypothetical protein